MKILTCNTGYFLGFDRPLPDYLFDPKRSCLGSRKVEQERISNLQEIIETEEPELVALQEVDQGSIRTETSGQVKDLERRLDTHSGSAYRKYGPGKLISSLPMMRKMSNALLHRNGGETIRHFVKPGSKQLMLERKDSRTGYSIFNVHLPTLHGYRSKQLRQVREKILERNNSILCGDFNCYRGKEEVEKVFEDTAYRVESPGPTHPRDNPHRHLNLFVIPEEFEVSIKRIDKKISDHFPVLAEIQGI